MTRESPGELARQKAYVRQIEQRFNALRASGLYISPRDFALLLDWYDRGVPASLVIAAIEGAFAKAAARAARSAIQSITYCRRAVEEAWEDRRAAMLGAAPAKGAAPSAVFGRDEIAVHLDAAAAAISRSAVGMIGEARSMLEEVAAALGAHGRSVRDPDVHTDLPALEAQLALLEERALEAARVGLDASTLQQLAATCETSLAPFSARMSERARAATLRRALDGAIRAKLGMPRFSLFAMRYAPGPPTPRDTIAEPPIARDL